MKASRTFKYGAHDVTIETGVVARQADGAVLVNMADTVVLVTAVGEKKDVGGRDFFPLTVNYQEKTYAAGRIPGGFFKREGKPTEKEVLTSRLIDRPCRPLFPAGWRYDILRGLDYLRNAGVAPDPRMAEAVEIVASRRDTNGRWALGIMHPEEVTAEPGITEGQASRWNTLRALRVLNWYSARD